METGPQDATGRKDTAVHAANTSGVRKRNNILPVRTDNAVVDIEL